MKPFWLPFGLKPKEQKQDDGPRYADIYERAMAMAVDVSLLFMLLRVPFGWVMAKFYDHTDMELLAQAQQAESVVSTVQLLWQSGLPQLWLLNAAFQIGVMGMFIVGCYLKWHTTPGKWLFGISVRRRDLSRPEAWRYALRYLSLLPSAPLFFLMSFNKRHRALHDMMTGTVVIHTRPKGWYWQQVKRLWHKWRGAPESATPVE